MSQVALAQSPLRRFTQEKFESKGRVLSHLIGFCLFVYLFLDRIWFIDLPYSKYIDIPIRLVALWLLLDRFGRRGRVKVEAWDYLFVGFVATYGLGLVYADAFMIRNGGFLAYIEWMSVIASPLLFFLVVREASTRQGFRYDIVLGWILGILSLAGLLGLAQSLDILGLRGFSATLYNWAYYDSQMSGPSQYYQAHGPAPHANSMAMYMVLGLAFMPAFIRYPKLRYWAFAAAAIFVVTTFATYSRTGMLAVLSIILAFSAFYGVRKHYRTALSLGLTLITVSVLAVSIIFAFDVERFKVVLEGEGKVRNVKSEREGLHMRAEAMSKSLTLGSKFPLFGVGATASGLQNLRMITSNAYSFGTILTGLYTYTFVMHGMFGVVFVCGVLLVLLSFLWRKDVPESFAATAFGVGVVVAVFGIAENSLFLPCVTALIHVAAAMVMAARVRSVRKIVPRETALAQAA